MSEYDVTIHDQGDLARIAELDSMLRVAWSDIDDDFPDVVSEGDYEGWIEDLRRRAGKEGTQ